MYKHDLTAGSSLLAQLLHYGIRRPHRIFVIAGTALVLLSAAWVYCALGTVGSGVHPHCWFLKTDSTNGQHMQKTISQASSGSEWRARNPAVGAGSLIPPKIWQIILPKKQSDGGLVIDPGKLKDTASWLAKNTDYTYTLAGQNRADDFVQRHFSSEPKIVDAYNNVPNAGMKSDILRYLILHVEGGVYSDIDTVALKAIDLWVPPGLQDRVRLIVGIEFDRRDGGLWADITHWVQFCQWTIAAAPGHPIFRKMVDRVLLSLSELSETYKLPVNQLQLTSYEVMNSTGPAAWTDVEFEQLQQHDPALNTTKDLAFLDAPKLYGDILVLPIDGFGMGQPHSHSTHDGTIPEVALVQHFFYGSWRGD